METSTTIIHDGPYPLPLKLLLKLRKIVSPIFRPALNRRIRAKLEGIDFSILCNNCLGGVFYHDAGRSFTSPL